MLFVNDPKEWERLCIRFNRSRGNACYEYTIDDVIEMSRIVKNAVPVNANADIPREFFEMYIDHITAVSNKTKPISALFYTNQGKTEISACKRSELMGKLNQVAKAAVDRDNIHHFNLLHVMQVDNRRKLMDVVALLYVATILYGVKDTTLK